MARVGAAATELALACFDWGICKASDLMAGRDDRV
jgi:hypothetical protein